MAIAYGIALSQNWDRAYWAAFAVAFCGLASIGQSVTKAAMRMLGTLVAVCASLALIALFAQERWLFIAALSIYAAFFTFMMLGSKYGYFWQVCCFVAIIIAVDGGTDSVNAFQTGILRAQETGLGILVFSLVTIFVWPSTSATLFKTAAPDLAKAQRQYLMACFDLARGQGSAPEIQRLSAEEAQAIAHFEPLLAAAQAESSEVWESRRRWGRYQHQAKALSQLMARWRLSLVDAETLDLTRSLPDLGHFGSELDARLVEITSMLGGNAPQRQPQGAALPYDRVDLERLSHFDKAALVVARSYMLEMEQLTRSLFETVSALKGFSQADALPEISRAPATMFVPDLDRIGSVVRFLAMIWLAWLGVIYIADLPGGFGFLSFVGGIGLAIASMPQLKVSKLFVPAATSVLFAGVVYIFIMPALSSFLGLGLLIFVVTFAICYLFAAPQHALGKLLGLALFAVITSISNEQSYSFLSVANTALMFPLFFLLVAISAYIPWSTRPERVFMRLTDRFFRSSDYLLSAVHWDPQRADTRLQRWRNAFHAYEVATIPAKLGTWAPCLDDWVMAGASKEQVQAVVTRLQLLGSRMEQLLEERDNLDAPILIQQLRDDLRGWQNGIRSSMRRLTQGPAAVDQKSLQCALDNTLQKLEGRVRDVLDRESEDQFSEQDAESIYRLLGAYRGVSDALVSCVGNAGTIDWSLWRQERFA